MLHISFHQTDSIHTVSWGKRIFCMDVYDIVVKYGAQQQQQSVVIEATKMYALFKVCV